MKHRLLISAVLLLTVVLSSFKPGTSSKHFTTEYTKGPWYVHSYFAQHQKQTSNFSGKTLVFTDDGMVSVVDKDGTSTTGYYKTDGNTVSMSFNGDQYTDLNGEWTNNDADDVSLVLSRDSGADDSFQYMSMGLK